MADETYRRRIARVRGCAAWPALRNASPLLVTLVAVLAWAALILVVTRARYGSDIRALIVVGARNRLPPAFATIPSASPWGYDGQMYAALSGDPFLRRLDTPGYLDTPWYRATRVGVPALAWALALGRPALAVVLYQLLCWGLALAAVYMLARWLADERRSPWWALLAAGSAGTAAAVLRSTPDGAALCLVVTALYLHARGRWRWALAVAVAAVLTRETSLLAALAIAVEELRRRRPVRAAAFAVLPGAAGVAWQLYLRHVLGTAFDTGAGNFALPFAWLPEKLHAVFGGDHLLRTELVGTAAVLASACALVALLSRPAALDAPGLTFAAFSILGLLLAYSVYGEAWAYARALVALPALAVLLGAREAVRWRRWVMGSVAVLYLVTGAGLAAGEVRDALGSRGLLRALREGTVVPLPSAIARSGGSPRPVGLAPQPPLWVLPVADTKGRAGAVWHTRLALENPHARSVRVTLELYLTMTDPARPERRVVVLEARERREWRDVLGELFGMSGAGALKVTADGGAVGVRSVTSNVTLAAASEALVPALGESAIVRGRDVASFERLVHDPDPGAAVRTNLGLFSLAERPVRVRVEAFDGGMRALGSFEGTLEPYRFTQVDNVLGRVNAPRLDDASLHVTALGRDARFLAYASVIRGANATPVYVYPTSLAAGNARR